jgi:hypothetical protein
MAAWCIAVAIVSVIAAWLAALPAAALDLRAQFIGSAPVYLFRDLAGNAYALELPAPGGPALGKHYLTSADFAALADLGATIAYLPEHPDATIGPCTFADFPANFNIAFVGGTVFGNIAKCDPGGRPSGAQSQIVEFVLFTDGYDGQAAHTAVIPWFKNALHGHGIYFGDTSAYPCRDGQASTFNTRIEGWSQWSGYGPSRGPYWTSTGPFESATCGTAMTDGWASRSGIVTAAYKVTVRASADQWVRYDVQRWNGAGWVVHTAPLARDMRYASWSNGPGTFDATANGFLVGSTGPSSGATSGPPWVVAIRELSTTWAGGWKGAATSSAVEFYHSRSDHYFMTADPGEIDDLDRGVHPGWKRTGQALATGPRDARYAEPVCRFYGLPSAGLDSHFYSASSGECEEVEARYAGAWLLESTDVFSAALPDTVTGECPPDTQPVYRLWNGRSDSNHRYATDVAVRQSMLARGFLAEGYGKQGVAMCSPLRQ